MNPSLDLLFFYFSPKQVKKIKLSFQDKIENIERDKMAVPIPETVFKYGKNKIAVQITLYGESDKSEKSENYTFNLYYGKNSAYVKTDCFSKYVYELILKNMKNVKIEHGGKEFKELDNLGNKCRERLTLINYDYRDIQINGIIIDLSTIIFENTDSGHNKISGFNQISVLDFENNIYIIQPIKEKSEYDANFFKDNKELILSFEKIFNSFLKASSSNYKDVYQNIKDKFKKIEQHGALDLNRDNDYLNTIFSKNSFLDLDLFWNYSLFYFFSGNSIEYMFFHQQVILTLIQNIKRIIKELKKNNELPLYEKIRVIYSSFTLLFMKKILSYILMK